MPLPDGFSKESVRALYWDGENTIAEIAATFGVSPTYVCRKMKAWEIPVRAKRGRVLKKPPVSEKYLRAEYLEKGRTIYNLADEHGASTSPIIRWMDYYGIERRKGGGRRFLDGTLTYNVLHTEYWENKKSLSEIAGQFGVSSALIGERMKEYGIPRRQFSESNRAQWTKEKREERSIQLREWWQDDDYRARMTGENAPTWNGGTSNEPYPFEFDMNLKKQIRKRDNYTCAICRMPARSVHHIDYDKNNLGHDNLIVLCRSCHTSSNHNRELWQEALMEIRDIESRIDSGSLVVEVFP